MLQTWMLLLLSLPPRPSSLRVRAWRRLRALGAVPLKSSAYLLPDSPERYEQFQWLAQEIQRDGGEATLLKVDRIENMEQGDVIRLFQEARDLDYAVLAERYRRLLKGSRPRQRDALARLAREMERVGEIDFFDAPGRREAERTRDTVELRMAGSGEPAGPAPAPLDPAALQGRRWATRPRPHVDRIASAWLIRRFIDAGARFVFCPVDEIPADAIPFDVAGAELGHHGEDCTFETLLRRLGLRDRKLAAIAEIVHEVDLKDQKFAREEARGIDLALRGLLSALKDDHEVLAQGMTFFDGLYAAIGERP